MTCYVMLNCTPYDILHKFVGKNLTPACLTHCTCTCLNRLYHTIEFYKMTQFLFLYLILFCVQSVYTYILFRSLYFSLHLK